MRAPGQSAALGTAIRWTFVLLLTAGSLRFFPGLRFLTEAWVLVGGVLALAAIRHLPPSPHPFERYLIGMMVYLPLASTLAAYRSFGQPIIYGMLQQRGILVCGVTLHLLRMARSGSLDLEALSRGFRYAAALMTGYGILVRSLIDGSRLGDIKGFYNASSGEFATDATFVVFGTLFFAADALHRGSGRSALVATGLLGYLAFVDGGRAQLAAVLATLVFIGLWFSTVRQRVFFLTVMTLATPLLLFLLRWFTPAQFQALTTNFQDALLVVITGEEGLDASANSRLLQIDLGLPFVQEHPWVGNGMLSARWQDGFEGVLGYFHPTDTGLFGAIFVLGVFGLALTLWQLRYAVVAVRAMRTATTSTFFKATLAFLVFWTLRSITSALLTLVFDWSVFVVGLLVAHQLAGERGQTMDPTSPPASSNLQALRPSDPRYP